MKSILLTLALVTAGASLAQAADDAAPAPLPTSTIEIFHIVPGQHEAFINMLIQLDKAADAVGLKPNQLYIHEHGGSWDFILVKPHGQDPKKYAAMSELLRKEGFPSGPDYFFESRKIYASHEDTDALGPTTAAAYLATRKKK